MKTNQVHPAVQSTEQLHQFLGINQAVVHPLEHDVFKRQTALLAEIIPAEYLHHLGNGESLLCRHQFPALGREGRMQTDGQVAVTFFQETFQSFPQSYGRNRDTLRAPFVAIVGSQDFQSTQHFVQVVKRFAHAHKYHVGQRIPFRHRINLIQNLGSCQAGRVSLLPGHTEFAVHLASHL